MAVDPGFDATLSLPGGNGTARGYRPDPAWPPGMLAADADRERGIDVLNASFAEGRLTRAEHDDRTARVRAARTYGELGALIADLPTGPLGGAALHPSAWYPPQQPARADANSMALSALVCGIAQFFTLGLTAIPAIVLGHAARRQIRRTGQRGDGMALTGLVLGWAGVGLMIVLISALVVVSSHAGDAVVAKPNPAGVPAPAIPGGPIIGGN